MITSLHSPHVEAVKALLGSRGNKERRTTGTYVVEGLSNIKELLLAESASLRTLYITEDGARKFGANLPENSKIIEVSP
ncbi:MAG: RNA methyltransferase, partial [Actinobacteria bacterium]|nr:RNA methyltransferase [Actinomycetota bacterium]